MDGADILKEYDLLVIVCGIVMGTVARIMTIRIGTRQVPSYPTAYLINLVTGFIAAGLGAIAIPALLARDFAAISFLALAVQHFRDVRKQEQESLMELEHTEFVERGEGYIDGIAKTYEMRNYISMLTSLGTVLALEVAGFEKPLHNLMLAFVTGAVLIWAQVQFTKGKRIGDICDIAEGQIDVKGSDLYVDGIHVTNLLGTERAQNLFRSEGLAIVVKPRQEKHRLTVEHNGQRKAMLFDAARSYGVKIYHFTQRNEQDGRVVIAFVPILRDTKGIMDTIRATPILESGRKRRYALSKG